MDYIVPATCNDSEFRQMWAEFEWENKVSVNTNLTDLHDYLQHLIKSTNMKCLTPEKVKRLIKTKMCLIIFINLRIFYFFRPYPVSVASWLLICMPNQFSERMLWLI